MFTRCLSAFTVCLWMLNATTAVALDPDTTTYTVPGGITVERTIDVFLGSVSTTFTYINTTQKTLRFYFRIASNEKLEVRVIKPGAQFREIYNESITLLDQRVTDQDADQPYSKAQLAMLGEAEAIRKQLEALEELAKTSPQYKAIRDKLYARLNNLLLDAKLEQRQSGAPALRYGLIKTASKAVKELKNGKVVTTRRSIVTWIVAAEDNWGN